MFCCSFLAFPPAFLAISISEAVKQSGKSAKGHKMCCCPGRVNFYTPNRKNLNLNAPPIVRKTADMQLQSFGFSVSAVV